MSVRQHTTSTDTASTEARRTFLSCYIICASVSLSLRRPIMLRCSSYIKDCVQYLDNAPDAAASDSALVAWVRLIMIAEEISAAFSLDDLGDIASIVDLRTQMMLKDFRTRLDAWHYDVTQAALGTGSILIMYYTVRLYLFEIALVSSSSIATVRARNANVCSTLITRRRTSRLHIKWAESRPWAKKFLLRS